MKNAVHPSVLAAAARRAAAEAIMRAARQGN